MVSNREANRATAAIGALLVVLICGGCSRHGLLRSPIVHTAEDEHIRITLQGEAWGNDERPGLLCLLTIENVSADTVTVYDIPPLPTVLHVPAEGVEVFYGMAPVPKYAFFYGAQAFPMRILQPGGRYGYAFVLSNPLRERAVYGNPAYDDPASRHYRRKPAPDEMLWSKWRVRVGYFPFILPPQDGEYWACPIDTVERQGQKRLLIKLQRELDVGGSIPARR